MGTTLAAHSIAICYGMVALPIDDEPASLLQMMPGAIQAHPIGRNETIVTQRNSWPGFGDLVPNRLSSWFNCLNGQREAS